MSDFWDDRETAAFVTKQEAEGESEVQHLYSRVRSVTRNSCF